MTHRKSTDSILANIHLWRDECARQIAELDQRDPEFKLDFESHAKALLGACERVIAMLDQDQAHELDRARELEFLSDMIPISWTV